MANAPPLHGRSAELALLDEQLELAVRRAQQLVVLEGDAGIGKTSLLLAFAHRHGARGWRRGARSFHLRAPAGEAYLPVHHAALAATSQRVYDRLGGRRQAREVAGSLATDWLAARAREPWRPARP
jgi:predicted ATPase